jgi:hypothetical protein
MFVPDRKHIYVPPRPATGIALLLYFADIRTSQERHLWASTACYGDRFTFLYLADVRTSQETHLWASTACYGDSLTFFCVVDIRSSKNAPMGHHCVLRG